MQNGDFTARLTNRHTGELFPLHLAFSIAHGGAVAAATSASDNLLVVCSATFGLSTPDTILILSCYGAAPTFVGERPVRLRKASARELTAFSGVRSQVNIVSEVRPMGERRRSHDALAISIGRDQGHRCLCSAA
jgi:hypothetical protein